MSKRLWVLPLLVVLLIVGLAGLAQAVSSLSGPTGVVATPTAEIAPEGLASVVLSRQSLQTSGEDLKNWELQALGSIAEQAEMWVAYSSIDNTFGSKLWGLGGKVQVYHAPASATAVAVGAGWYKWQDGLLSWAEGLPLEGKIKWANSTPAAVRDDVRRVLGLSTPQLPDHVLTVTALANPGMVAAEGGTVTLEASAIDRLGYAVAGWHWSVSPSNAGTFANANAADTTFTVNPLTGGTGRTITFTATATSSAPDGLRASDTCAVGQAAGEHVLVVTATVTPPLLYQPGGLVNLDASFTDSVGAPVASWHWSAPPGVGHFSEGQNSQHALFSVDPSAASGLRNIVFTVTATSAVDAVQSQGQCLLQQYGSGHSLVVTATATPDALGRTGGTVDLSATATDNQGYDIAQWAWTVSPANAGHFTSATDGPTATFLVDAFGMYLDDARTITFTMTATSDADDLEPGTASADVVQTYRMMPSSDTSVAATAAALATAPAPSKSALANLATARRTLQETGARAGVGALRVNDPFAKVLAQEDVQAWNAYAVATTDLSRLLGGKAAEAGLLGSAGFMYTKADPSLGDSLTLARPFLSAKLLTPQGAAFGLEYRFADSDLDAKAIFSALAGFALSEGLALEFGTTNASPIGLGLEERDWFLRVGYTLPLSKF